MLIHIKGDKSNPNGLGVFPSSLLLLSRFSKTKIKVKKTNEVSHACFSVLGHYPSGGKEGRSFLSLADDLQV